MCAKQERNGVDSAEAWNPRPFRVYVCDRFDPDERRWIKVAAAIGPHDAKSQVRTDHPDVSVLLVEEVEPEPPVRDPADYEHDLADVLAEYLVATAYVEALDDEVAS